MIIEVALLAAKHSSSMGLAKAAVGIAALIFSIVTHIRAAKARKQIRKWALQKGFHYARKDTGKTLYGRLVHFVGVLRRGTSRAIYDIIEIPTPVGTTQTLLFNFLYYTQSGRQRVPNWLACGLITLNAHFPETVIRREFGIERILDLIGFPDINFEWAEFSRAFRVKSAKRKFAFLLINHKMMEFLMEKKDLRIGVYLSGPYIFFWSDGFHKVEKLQTYIEFMRDFWDRVPELARQEAMGRKRR